VTNIFYYSLYGRLLASDSELPILSPLVDSPGDAEMTLRLCAPRLATLPAGTPWYRSERIDVSGRPSIAIEKTARGDLIVRFADGTVFLIGPGGRVITLVSAPDAYTRDDVAAYALGPVTAVALHIQGAVLLHASAVAIQGKAVVFAGQGRTGKSTIAAILHRDGYPFLSDDIAEILGANPFHIGVSPPAIRLWPDVADALYGASKQLPDLAPSWNKKIVRADGVKANERAIEIAAILFLDEEERGTTVRLQHLPPRQGWQKLMTNAYTAHLPEESVTRKIFEVTSALAGCVAMYTFTPPSIESSSHLGVILEKELAELFR
jgi:hypothetical protein